MKKGLIVAGLLAVAAPAFAEQTAEVFEARITEQQSFDYTTATAMNPVYAQAETLDGQCKFTISVVGMQGGVGPGGGGEMTGRVELTQCFANAGLKWSSVSVMAKGIDGKALLGPHVMVAIQRR